MTENEVTNRLSPTPPPLSAGPAAVRLPLADHSKSASTPRPPPSSGVRASVQPGDISKVRQTGELLQNMMLRQQKTPGPKPGQTMAPTPPAAPLPLQQPLRQRSAGDVTPLRRPLPPEGPLPLKPKRPPSVKLDQYRSFKRVSVLARKGDAPPRPADKWAPVPAVISPPNLPQRFTKPKPLPHQVASVDFEDEQDPYDDIASFDKSGSCSDNSSQCWDKDEHDDVYEFIDDDLWK
ncbi:wiskott-Aldrich syndrome protein homolog 1 isoform X2 [Salarias fasciatus]|uniref:wiskott-Aldrich syndrome protein homolog 1 isoform X2 n=1 Tax=Salarias fasciatus TaxID=181472 RepID=UPI00117686C5|nr:wiskott-Aldrich syndrome protein homolog 1-like isoform X2 [Salarias fasciatus]